jgi:signal transduction histidine kinase
VAKHAQAQNVNIQMAREGDVLKLAIEDDGVGITRTVSNPLRPSFGMAGMHERIAALGGQMKVVSHKGEGTKISVTVPLPAATLAAADNAGAEHAQALMGTG